LLLVALSARASITCSRPAKTGAPAEYAETMSPGALDQISDWILKQ